MSSLAEIYIKKETLEVILKTLTQKQEKGVKITLSINDESNEYGNNISSYVSQSEEDRKAKKDKFYIGNGKVFWTNGGIVVGTRDNRPKQESNSSPSKSEEDGGDLPF